MITSRSQRIIVLFLAPGALCGCLIENEAEEPDAGNDDMTLTDVDTDIVAARPLAGFQLQQVVALLLIISPHGETGRLPILARAKAVTDRQFVLDFDPYHAVDVLETVGRI